MGTRHACAQDHRVCTWTAMGACAGQPTCDSLSLPESQLLGELGEIYGALLVPLSSVLVRLCASLLLQLGIVSQNR